MLFKQGDDFHAIYAIRTGAIKSFTVAPSGEEQITGFHLASEITGLSGYAEDVYPLSAKALETTTVCELPLDKLEVLCDEISGLKVEYPAGTKVFHAGTKELDGKVVTSGGRVLCATALGNTVTEAQQSAYELVKEIDWKGVEYRTDIAYRAIEREQS